MTVYLVFMDIKVMKAHCFDSAFASEEAAMDYIRIEQAKIERDCIEYYITPYKLK